MHLDHESSSICPRWMRFHECESQSKYVIVLWTLSRSPVSPFNHLSEFNLGPCRGWRITPRLSVNTTKRLLVDTGRYCFRAPCLECKTPFLCLLGLKGPQSTICSYSPTGKLFCSITSLFTYTCFEKVLHNDNITSNWASMAKRLTHKLILSFRCLNSPACKRSRSRKSCCF